MGQYQLVDAFGRRIDYLRLSVTDRCDFRCTYCMSEKMTFMPRHQVLSHEELYQVADAFIALGVTRIRITGGEPLVSKDTLPLVEKLGRCSELHDLAMTTNGTQLAALAAPLKKAGLNRLNISLDSLQEPRFHQMTRTGHLGQVRAGIEAAVVAGFERIKLNTVVLKGRNDDEILDLVAFACDLGIDISFIEEMPLGQISSHRRSETFFSSDEVRGLIETRYGLFPSTERTGGPSRYFRIEGAESRVGFISPHSRNFCGDCNRVRVTAEGRLLLCLGNEHSVDLKAIVRRHPGDSQRLQQAIVDAMSRKPERHHFSHRDEVQVVRFMNSTGG